MAKTESTFFNMVMTLFIVTLLSSSSVGYIYVITKEPIAKANLAKKTAAIKEVLPEFDNNPLDEKFVFQTPEGDLNIYPAKKQGLTAGMAVETFSDKAFGGTMKLMVGLNADGSIKDIVVLEHKETPGLGDKIQRKKSDFSKQFAGKNPADYRLSVKKDGGDVDAITAATISSRAFCDAVVRAYRAYTDKK